MCIHLRPSHWCLLGPVIGFLWLVGATPAVACFGDDRPAFSTDRNDHRGWAAAHDSATVSANLTAKITSVVNCGTTDEQLRDLFADLSEVIARFAPRADCFNGDMGVVVAARQQHRDWASSKSRAEVIANLTWKASAALSCLDPATQAEYFADMSVILARWADKLRPAPSLVVWKLGLADIKDVAPSGTKALHIDEMHADATGGLVRITALNDGGCAPDAGVPGRPLEQRFWFRWRFSRDVSRMVFPDKIDINLSIEADGNVPCFDLNPIMSMDVDGRAFTGKLMGARYLLIPNTQAGHVPGPRSVEVWTPESGLERSSVAMKPWFKIAIWGFRGQRGMQLEAQYPYELASQPPRK
jgi:hypothetical protein